MLGQHTLLSRLKNRLHIRRGIIISFAVSFTATFLLIVLLHPYSKPAPPRFNHYVDHFPTCRSKNMVGSESLWHSAQDKYTSLRDDKFSVAIQTYQRPDELNATLANLIDHDIPSLHEIHIVWNELEVQPPSDFVSSRGIPVRYRWSSHNSLNEKLRPDPSFATQAILLSDDDVYYKPGDLEFAFQTWRSYGRDRLVGALARCADPSKDGAWKYGFCSNKPGHDGYSMIITNLAFIHISFLDYYWSEDPTMTTMRSYVDDHFNCEDIAMNYVTSMLTGSGPMLVAGLEKYFHASASVAISLKKGHIAARSRCLNDLTEIFGCMSLINVTGYMQKGVTIKGWKQGWFSGN